MVTANSIATTAEESFSVTNKMECVDVWFVVTGFGPFDQVRVNPTTILVTKLVEHLEKVYPHLAKRIETIVIETSAEAVKKCIDDLEGRMKKCYSERTTVILLHLGVDTKGKQFAFEQCAYNEATFRVPDQRGFQPTGVSILGEDYSVGLPLDSVCDVVHLVNEMNAICSESGCKEDCPVPAVVLSTNPGRFVCNYTYCCSLHKFHCWKGMDQSRVAGKPKVQCLFVHVPPSDVVSEERQLEFVANLINIMHKGIVAESIVT